MKLSNVKDVAILAALAGGAYLAYNFAKGAKETFTGWGEAIGSGLFDLFHRDQVGETLFYTVTFPDGQRHAVPSRSVSGDGTFTNKNLSPQYAGDGKRYRIVVAKNGAKAAFLV